MAVTIEQTSSETFVLVTPAFAEASTLASCFLNSSREMPPSASV
eukprot:CAMPEP_0181491536 /NCGR_PEP_ID=MMETSP1110-20121109/50183_1 /TAXON_ID=174948 /ORGANISM="Symbiodinium sp., Strain CCMP421" /LENGTH=43 /DNA_ID= /DNA_START= /DNA_END= /DNA_ORIENTATION=